MYFNKKSDSAVSPVIGVILMVAITVILAAVIGSFVLNLGGNLEANPQAGVTFDTDSAANEITVQVVSMDNADSLDVTRSGVDTYSATLNAVGDSVTVGDTTQQTLETYSDSNVDDVDLSSGETITVIGTLDGKEAVIQSKTYSP